DLLVDSCPDKSHDLPECFSLGAGTETAGDVAHKRSESAAQGEQAGGEHQALDDHAATHGRDSFGIVPATEPTPAQEHHYDQNRAPVKLMQAKRLQPPAEPGIGAVAQDFGLSPAPAK